MTTPIESLSRTTPYLYIKTYASIYQYDYQIARFVHNYTNPSVSSIPQAIGTFPGVNRLVTFTDNRTKDTWYYYVYTVNAEYVCSNCTCPPTYYLAAGKCVKNMT